MSYYQWLGDQKAKAVATLSPLLFGLYGTTYARFIRQDTAFARILEDATLLSQRIFRITCSYKDGSDCAATVAMLCVRIPSSSYVPVNCYKETVRYSSR